MIKKITTLLAAFSFAGSMASAVTLGFNSFGADEAGQNSGDFSVTGVASGTDYIFTFTSTGQDFDGVGGANDSFSFDVRYQAFTGSTVSATGLGTSSVTLGTAVGPNTASRNFGTVSGGLNQDNSFKLTVENFVVTSDLASTATFNGFNTIFFNSGNPKTFVIGEGAGLDSFNTSTTTQALGGLQELVISSKNPGERFFNLNGSFEVAAVPEASTYALILGAICLGVVAVRRRK